MTDLQWLLTHWYFLVLPFVGGSILGVLAYAALAAYRSSNRPISRRVEFLVKFANTLGTSTLQSQLMLSDGQVDYPYNRLHIGEIQVDNKSRHCFEEFKLGLTLSPGDLAIYVEARSQDRHHQVQQLTPLSFAEPQSELDFVLRPFYPGESYSLRVFVITSTEQDKPGEITFSSPQDVHFINMPTIAEVVEQAARSAAIQIGPFKMSFYR